MGAGGEGKTRAPIILPTLSFYAPSCFATGQFPQKKEAGFLNKNFPLENEASGKWGSGGRRGRAAAQSASTLFPFVSACSASRATQFSQPSLNVSRQSFLRKGRNFWPHFGRKKVHHCWQISERSTRALERNQPRRKSRVIIVPPDPPLFLLLSARKESSFGGRGKMSSISAVRIGGGGGGDLPYTTHSVTRIGGGGGGGGSTAEQKERRKGRRETGKQQARISRAQRKRKEGREEGQ